jgi:DNA-binding NtrC family response regulator
MSKQILIVDDERNVRFSYRVTLELEGFTVFEAEDAAKALALFATHSFDLAILDMRMPEMDGLDLLAEMRHRGVSTPVVIITAYGDVPHAIRAMKLGAIDFLEKPLTPEQLRRIVHEVVGRHAAPASTFLEVEPDPALTKDELHALYLQEAKRMLNLQQFAEARASLAKAMALNPLSSEAFNLAGVLFEMQEAFAPAQRFYEQAIKLNTHSDESQANLRRLFALTREER